uniref:(California timema) hypothetical protein n=1 Tax=Timema californicum TaxID=61474 RepID=A0A7R9J1E2_TIMCA|nr:unnamed protein product [Timema californicum]
MMERSVFDFRLARQRIWEAKLSNENEDQPPQYMFIAMCRHFDSEDADKCPDTNASVCIARHGPGENEWIPVIPNLGSQIKLNDTSIEKVHFIGGQICNDKKNYTTEIKFVCDDAYCRPLLYNETGTCTLELPGDSGRFDIQPLRRPTHYTIQSSDGRLFELNFCSPISDSRCGFTSLDGVSVCEVNATTGGKSRAIGITRRSVLQYIEEKGLKMIYHGPNDSKGTGGAEITLVCNENITFGEPVFKAELDNLYKFELETSLACLAWPVECAVFDREDNKFDLGQLRKTDGNWEVTDPGQGKVRFHINICGALNPVKTYVCPGANVGACRTNSSESTNLGSVTTGPKINADGVLTLHYTGGSPCEDGRFRHSTHIVFHCLRVENGPRFIKQSEDCVSSFLWETPVACPVKYVVGKNCQVREPSYSAVFDLRPLHRPGMDYSLTTEQGDHYRVNICGTLDEPCGGYDNASICLTSGGRQIPIAPYFWDGRVAFEFHGAECKPGNKSTVHLILLCNHKVQLPDSNIEYLSKDDRCNFYFVWNTALACTPSKEVECIITDDKGEVYDLTSLSLSSSNHMNIDRGRKHKFFINVCHSVVFGYGSMCAYNAGVCMEDLKKPNYHNRFHNLGEVSEGPKFVDGILTLNYDSGEICSDPQGAPHYTSTINFYCDPTSVETTPQLLVDQLCHYVFMWVTSAACPQRSTRHLDSNSTGDCTATNPATNFRFNLIQLKETVNHFDGPNGFHYSLSICDNLDDSVCGSMAGACRTKDNSPLKEVLGIGHSNLQYQDGQLFLNYSGGKLCQKGTRQSIRVQFMCGAENTTQGPKLLEELDDCSTLIAWNTELACEHRILCQAFDGDNLVDLSPLISFDNNYEVTVNRSRFFVNVCRPVLPFTGLGCPPGSGACVAHVEEDGELTQEFSLGYPHFSPVLDKGEAVLKYMLGSPCPVVRTQMSSSFHFKCDVSAGKGAPVLKSITQDCQYQFDWKTSVVCPSSEQVVSDSDNYVLRNKELNTAIDLRPLCKHDVHKVIKGGKTFYLNLCSSKTTCDGAAVCRQTDSSSYDSYGENLEVEFDYANNLTKLLYTSGSLCHKSAGNGVDINFSAEVWLKCDPTADEGQAEIVAVSLYFTHFTSEGKLN